MVAISYPFFGFMFDAMGIFKREGCTVFLFIILTSVFCRKASCQCSDGKIVETSADYSPGSLFFRPYFYSIRGEQCELRFIPVEPTKSVLIQLKLNHVVCGVADLSYTFSETAGEHSLCTNDTDTFDIIVASPGETITIKTNTRQSDYDYSMWLEVYLLASDDKSGSGCNGLATLTPHLNPKYVSSPNFPFFYTLNRRCSWRIEADDSDFDIQIRVLFVDIRSGDSDCSRDYLEITNVQTPANKFRLCDRGSFLKTALRVSSQGADVTFFDLRRPLHGFLIEYQLVNKTCTNPKADIAFLLDSSGSISTFNFRLMLSFVSLLISKYDLRDSSLQTSVVSFSTDATVHFDLNDYTSTYDVLSFISAIIPKQQNTYTDRGIRIVREQVFSVSNGDRVDNPNILVIFTDGVSTEPNKTLDEVNKIKENGVKVIAIGIQGFDEKEINLLASNSRYSLKIEKFNDLEKLQNVLQELICLATEESVKLTTETSTRLTSASNEKDAHTSMTSISTTLPTESPEQLTIEITTETSTQDFTSKTEIPTTALMIAESTHFDSQSTKPSTSSETSTQDNTSEGLSTDFTELVTEIATTTGGQNIQTSVVSSILDPDETTTQHRTKFESTTNIVTGTTDLTEFITEIATTTGGQNIQTSVTSSTEDQDETTRKPRTTFDSTKSLVTGTTDFTEFVTKISTTTGGQNMQTSGAWSNGDPDETTTQPRTTFESVTKLFTGTTDFTEFVTEVSTTNGGQNIQTSEAWPNRDPDETTTQPRTTFESVTKLVTGTTDLSTRTSTYAASLFFTSATEMEVSTAIQTSEYKQSVSSTQGERTTSEIESGENTQTSSFSVATNQVDNHSETAKSTQEFTLSTEEASSTIETSIHSSAAPRVTENVSTEFTVFTKNSDYTTRISETSVDTATQQLTMETKEDISTLYTDKPTIPSSSNHHDSNIHTAISESTTEKYSTDPNKEFSKSLGETSVQVVTSTQMNVMITEELRSTENAHPSDSPTLSNPQEITMLTKTRPSTTTEISYEEFDKNAESTAAFSMSTQRDISETNTLIVQTSKLPTSTQRQTSITGGNQSSKNVQTSATDSPQTTNHHTKIVSMTTSLGNEKSTDAISKSSELTQDPTTISTESTASTLSSTNKLGPTDDSIQTKNFSGFYTTENVAIGGLQDEEEGGGLSSVAIWGITLTGITLVLGISSCCGCCYLIGGYRRKKRKRKRRRKHEKQNWQRLFDDVYGSSFIIDFRNGHVPTRMDSKMSSSLNSRRNKSAYLNDMYPYEDLHV